MSDQSVTENTTTTYTPGPWFVRYAEGDQSGTPGIAYIKAETGHREVCVIYCDDPAHQLADAQAISAVPELIAALRNVDDYFEDSRCTADVFDALRDSIKAALAKAGVR